MHWYRSQKPLWLIFVILWSGQAYGQSPGWKAAFSLVVPGLGQAMNGDVPEAGAHWMTFNVLLKQYTDLTGREDYLTGDRRIDPAKPIIYTNKTTFYADVYGQALNFISFYSAYGAYRDARNQMQNAGYNTPAPPDSLSDILLAPFNPAYLFRPSTLLVLAVPLYYLTQPPGQQEYLYMPDNTITREEMKRGFAAEFIMTAAGEEAFYRGTLNNSFSSAWGPGWGLAASSLAFGLAHQGAPGQANIASATLAGMYLGYLQQENDYHIGQSVAIHFWWDFLISLSMLATRKTAEIPYVRLFSFAYQY